MIKMGDVNTDQEKSFLCILKLLKKGSNNDFEKLQELCKEISDDMGDVNTVQEKKYLCILKLLKMGNNDDFEKLQELCKEISADMPDLKIANNVTYMGYPADERAKKLLASSVAKEREDVANLIPVETAGDGSCLFRALSFLCFGHQNRHRELKVRCIIEMAVNKNRYLNDENLFERSKAEDYILKKCNAGNIGKTDKSKSDKSASGTEHDSVIENGSYEETSSFTEEDINDDTQPVDHDSEESGFDEADFTNDVLKTCELNEFAKFWHIQALGVILKRKIENICCSNETEELKEEYIQLKNYIDCTLDPRDLDTTVPLQTDEPPLKIMWLLDTKHFVPLIPAESGRGIPPPKESDNANVKNAYHSVDDMDEKDFEPSHTSTPKKAAKDEASIKREDVEKGKDKDEKVDMKGDKVMDELNKLFKEKDIRKRLFKKHLSKEALKTLTGPYQFADPDILGILKSSTVIFVAKLIGNQFQIKWNTDDGRPERFNFYDFCNVEKKTTHLKYQPRKAHVFTQLYWMADDIKERDKREKAFFTDEAKEVFCPDVYVRVNKHGWVRICFASKECEQVKDFKERFSWMHASLQKFVTEAEEITLPPNSKVVYSSVTKAICQKHILYWAVLEDTDFKSGNHLKLHEIGKTQVYVGKANGGIRRRWITYADSHAKKMKKCAESICKMKESFDMSRLDGIQLVAARLLLAKIRKEKHAVFLLRKFKCAADLEKGEKKHREGKRIGNSDEDIVSCEDIRDWTPKKMEFGMNCN